MNLVVVPFHDWKKCEREGFRTRDAHLIQEFGRHPSVRKVLVVNRPTSLAEMALLRRGWRVQSGRVVERSQRVCVTQVGTKTYTLDVLAPEVLRPALLRRNWTPRVMAEGYVGDAVRGAMEAVGIDRPYALLIFEPWFVPLVEQLCPDVFALDALDNMLKHAMYKDMPNLESYYRTCQRKADALFANSQETTAMLARSRPDALHIPNGVDASMFGRTADLSCPDDMVSLPRPVIGYAGKMQEMVDAELVTAAARRLPKASFVFIGQQLNPTWMKPVWRHPNVHYLGDKRYELLPMYLNAFDICIIPYSVARQHGGDPIKFYEYLAAGKPVVTTKIGNVSAYSSLPQVRVVEGPEQFAEALEHFVSVLEREGGVQTAALPSECTWAAKADQMVRVLSDKIDQKQNRRTWAEGA